METAQRISVKPLRSIKVVGETDEMHLITEEQQKIQSLQIELDALHVDIKKLNQEKTELLQVCRVLDDAAAEFKSLQGQVFSAHREQIARLSVAIAEKILMKEIQRENYDIQNLIEECLKTAPSRNDVYVRLNPQDMKRLKEVTGDNDVFENLHLEADTNVGMSECIVETDEGIIDYFIQEHLTKIEEALSSQSQ